MMFSQSRILLLLLTFLFATIPGYGADGNAAFSMSATEFFRLSDREQKKILAAAFEYRLQHAKNIYYEAELRGGNNAYRDGQVGERVDTANERNVRHWRLGDSYRMDTDCGAPNVANPIQWEISGFDAASGVAKSTGRFKDTTRTFGRIDVDHDPITITNRYAYWLDGKHTAMAEYLIRYLIEHKDSYTIRGPIEQGKVHLTLPWIPRFSRESLGTREFILDPEKGLLPIKGKARMEFKQRQTNGERNWRTEEFAIEASELVGDVWMPIKLKEIIRGSTLSADKANVWETTVTKIETGKVTAKDLEVPFPPGMEVVDAIKGIAYVVGPNGEPTKIDRLVGAAPVVTPLANEPKPPDTTRRNLLILINTVAGVALVVFFFWRFLAKRRAKLIKGAIQPSPEA